MRGGESAATKGPESPGKGLGSNAVYAASPRVYIMTPQQEPSLSPHQQMSVGDVHNKLPLPSHSDAQELRMKENVCATIILNELTWKK